MSIIEYIKDNYDHVESSGGSEIQLINITCPWCGAEKQGDLRFYLNTMTGKGVCHHCSRGFLSPYTFLKAMGDYCDNNNSQYIKTATKQASSQPYPENAISALNNERALYYLLNRGVNKSIISKYKIGFCENNYKYNNDIIYVGDRIIIPIFDSDDNMVSWIGRDITGLKKNKYLFPRGFKKANYLYNIQNIGHNPTYLIVVEGVMDVYGWLKAGYRNVVATFGKACSLNQLDILGEVRPKELIIAWDYGTDKETDNLKNRVKHLFDVRIVKMTKDSDEMSNNELKTAFEQKIGEVSWENKILSML